MLYIRFELSHCLYGILNRRFETQAVTVVVIYALDAKSLQSLRASFFKMVWIATKARIFRCAYATEIRSKKDLVPLSCTLEPFADQVFAVALIFELG